MSIQRLGGAGGASPFDSIRRTRADGSEYWSARELQTLMGYAEWRNMQTAIERAKVAIINTEGSLTSHVVDANTMVSRPQGGAINKGDFELSRYAAYLTAINGDPEKPETAAAQSYFAVQTRAAETAPPALTDDELIHRALTISTQRVTALTEKVAALEPKAEFFDALMDANGCYSMDAAAKGLGYGRNIMMRDLRKLGVLQGNNLPYQRYTHHFKVVPGTYVNRKSGETVPTATTWVRPSGLDFLRRKLQASAAAVLVGDQ